jgi:uncharacterized membrane-anchored protein
MLMTQTIWVRKIEVAMKLIVVGLLVLLVPWGVQAQINDQTRAEVAQMQWRPAVAQQLQTSQSMITSLPGFNMVSGSEAVRLRQIVDGRLDTSIEAYALNGQTGSELLFQYLPTGYVRSDDWQDVNSDDFLAQIRSNDEIANQERIKNGLPTLKTVGWRQKPNINNDLHTVSWMIEGEGSAGEHVINAVALKLGRTGIERMTWIIDPAKIAPGMNDLLTAETAQVFNAGARYTDYVQGTDKAAEYGVAGLVAGALGVKLLKVSAFGAVLLGLKKGAFLLFLPFVWLWAKLKKMFVTRTPNPRA